VAIKTKLQVVKIIIASIYGGGRRTQWSKTGPEGKTIRFLILLPLFQFFNARDGATTLTIMTFRIMTLSVTTFSIMAFSITTFRMVMPSITRKQTRYSA
jgi:hypothetical protein